MLVMARGRRDAWGLNTIKRKCHTYHDLNAPDYSQPLQYVAPQYLYSTYSPQEADIYATSKSCRSHRSHPAIPQAAVHHTDQKRIIREISRDRETKGDQFCGVYVEFLYCFHRHFLFLQVWSFNA